MDAGIVPAFCSGSSPNRVLKIGGVPDWTCELFPPYVSDHPLVESEKWGDVPDKICESSPRSVPDCPRIEPYKQGGVPNPNPLFRLVF